MLCPVIRKSCQRYSEFRNSPSKAGQTGHTGKAAQARRQPVPEQSGTWRLDLAVSLRARSSSTEEGGTMAEEIEVLDDEINQICAEVEGKLT